MKKNYFKKQGIAFLVILMCLLPAFTKAQSGSALYFDGINDHVNVPPMTSFTSTGKMTIEAWIKPTNITANPFYTITRQEASLGPSWLLAFQMNGTILSFGLNTAGGYSELDVPVTPAYYTDGNWHHVAAVYNGVHKQLFVDGALIGTEPRTGAIVQPGTGPVQLIGRSPATGTEHFYGYMDEVRYWDLARTHCEINTYKDVEIPSSAPGIIGNYHFNQGVASSANTGVTTLTNAVSGFTGSLVFFALTGTVSNWVAPGAVANGFTTTSLSPPSVGFSASSSSICVGGTVSLSGSGANTYSWTGGISNGIAFAPASSSSYTVVGTNTVNGCSATSVASITVNSLPAVAAAASSTLICNGSSVTLNASGADTYTWSGGVTSGLTFSLYSTSSYSVTGTNTLTGCSNTAAITLSAAPLPVVITLASTNTVCSGMPVTLTAGGADSFTWTPAISNGVAFTPTATMTYSAAGTDTATGCTSTNTAVQTVTVHSLPSLSISSSNSVMCLGETVNFTVTGNALTYTWSTTSTNSIISISPSASGSFTLSITGTGAQDCVNTANFTQVVSECTGLIAARPLETGLTVFPNPSAGEFNIAATSDMDLNLVNELGQLVRTISLNAENKQSVSLNQLKSGVYFITGTHNNKVIHQKIVVLGQ